MKKLLPFLFLSVILFAGIASAEEDGITSDSIIVGQSCALSGPAEKLGNKMRAGIEAYFAKINDAGGIHGRKITLISKDDGYEPAQAINNTRDFIEKD
jgi:branched-chain amino acid transport system substrate-binding protein